MWVYSKTSRVMLAFIVAPWAVPIVFATLGFARGEEFSAIYIVLLIYAYPAEIVFGLPTWLLFKHRRICSPWAYACTGGLIGLIVAVLILSSFAEFLFTLGCIMSAALAASVFWIISSPNCPPPNE